jgi:uncharacterized protein (TIGR01777 family)
MDVVISGASGLIGTALRESLLAAGHRPIALVRHAPRAGADEVGWDPAAGTIDAAGLEGVDGIVHLAGAGIGDKRWTDDYKRKILDSRTRSTALLARTVATLQRPPGTMVSSSGVTYYGDRGDDPVTETTPAGTLFLSEVCKRWEAATTPAVEAGIRVPITRTGIVLSRRGGALPKLLPLFKLGVGGRMGSGRQWWSWISITDHVRAVQWLLEPDNVVDGPVNLVAPGAVTNGDFAKVLARVLGRPALLPVPKFGPRLLRGRELADELLFASQRVAPEVLSRKGFRFEHPDLETALRAELDRPREGHASPRSST